MSSFESLCGSPLWDTNLTWNTTSPELTSCFTSTVLVWVPCGLLWLLLPAELLRAKNSKRGVIPWCALNITKVIFQCILIFLAFIRVICISQYNQKTQFYSSHTLGIASTVVELLTYVWLFCTQLFSRQKGLRVSMVVPCFWALWFLAQVALVYSIIQRSSQLWSEPFARAEYVIIMMTSVGVLIQMILSGFAEPAPHFERLMSDGVLQENCAFNKNGLFSILAFSWVNRMMYRGSKQLLTMENIPPICKDMISKKVSLSFDAAYERNNKCVKVSDPILSGPLRSSPVERQPSVVGPEPAKAKKGVSLLRPLWKTTVKPVMLGNVMQLIAVILYFLPPYMLQKMLDFVSSDEVQWHGFVYGTAFCIGVLFCNLVNSLSEYFFMVASVQVKSALISAIYRKILRISSATKKNYMAGEIVNLMAIDTQELFEFTVYLQYIWSVPLRLCLTMYFLWTYLGPACLASLAVIAVLTPISLLLARIVDKYQDDVMKRKDKRMKQMSEIMNGIKVLKLYAWEKPFIERVNTTRGEELHALKRNLYIDCFFSFLWIVAPFVICASCFAAYLLADRTRVLEPETAFVSLALFNLLRFPMGVLPDLITRWVKAIVSTRRLVKFLTSHEIDPKTVENHPNEGEAVSIQNSTLSWCEGDQPVLKDLTLNIPKGQLVAIVGPVGCGKSSILSSLLGELHKVDGHINITGSLAYVPQLAWIQNATLQQNILFTKSLNERRYNQVISACALRADLDLLPGGDMTEIGEKGINLSGGQKQRVSLARAVYQDADVYLFDDPLSAVDAHVAAHLFKHVVGPTGLLKSKTRIIATHNVSFLSQVDFVVVMAEGSVLEKGTYDQLMASEGHLSKFLQAHSVTENTAETSDGKRKMADRQMSVMSNDSQAPVETEELYRLTEEEAMQTGKVKWDVYWTYFKKMGLIMFTLTIIANLFSAGLEVGSGVWLSEWTDNATGLEPLEGLGVFAGFVAFQSVVVFLCYFFLFTGTLKASFHLHNDLLQSVMKSPLSFFDTTPTGRVLNRFSKDIESADSNVPWSMGNFINTVTWLPGIILVIAVTSSYLLAFFLPVFILYFFILRVYIITSNHLRRLDSVSRSPVYSNFTETIQGVASIRAYDASKYFIHRSNQRVDENHKCYYNSQVASRWLDSTLSLLSCVIVLATAFLAVLERGKIATGILGLALTYCIELTGGLNWVIRIGAFLESNIVGVERIKEYSRLTPEAPWEIEDTKPSRYWPDKGEIEIQNFSTRYRDDLDPVLQDVNLKISPGMKVGVVGRTGAGKSSLILSLFRIIEPTQGRIIIDDVDISEIGVHNLRAKLTVIPQDPVLFAGSLRMNLDPWDEHADESIWKALEQSHLKSFVSALEDGLQHTVAEGGDNLSAGQRQLVCLARALLRHTKVLVLDEATASVDLDTDNLIQDTVRDAFSDCTVITIAHRLNTILKCNKIIVFSQGHLVEEGCPDDLLTQPSSHFYSMAKDAGLV